MSKIISLMYQRESVQQALKEMQEFMDKLVKPVKTEKVKK